jgi:hypothetical protein
MENIFMMTKKTKIQWARSLLPGHEQTLKFYKEQIELGNTSVISPIIVYYPLGSDETNFVTIEYTREWKDQESAERAIKWATELAEEIGSMIVSAEIIDI